MLFWSAFFPHFSAFGYLSVFSPNAGKTRTRIISNKDSFYVVLFFSKDSILLILPIETECLRFSLTLLSIPEYVIFGEMRTWKTLQRLAAATERFSWEIKFPKMLRGIDR